VKEQREYEQSNLEYLDARSTEQMEGLKLNHFAERFNKLTRLSDEHINLLMSEEAL
jgi:hypothetical protein